MRPDEHEVAARVQRTYNLGNYESVQFCAEVSGVRAGDTPEQIRAAIGQAEVTFGLLLAELDEQAARLRDSRARQEATERRKDSIFEASLARGRR